MMKRLKCPKCSQEFVMQTGCSCCAPTPGPHFCPECGAVLRGMDTPYFVTGGWDEE
jgi:hypothetical protein